MPKAEYLDKEVEQMLRDYIRCLSLQLGVLEHSLTHFKKATIYHDVNDTCGLMAKYVEEGGFFNQILEEYF